MARAGQPPQTYLDTHVVAWLHDGLVERLSSAAARAIESGRLVLSEAIGLQRSEVAFATIVTMACDLSWTRRDLALDHRLALLRSSLIGPTLMPGE